MPILISEDGSHPAVKEVIQAAEAEFRLPQAGRGLGEHRVSFSHLIHPEHALPAENGYIKLSRHFKWALKTAFDVKKAKRVIILEVFLQLD